MMHEMGRWLRNWGVAALFLLAGVLLRVLFVVLHPWIAGDSLVYADIAQNMWTAHIYGVSDAAGIRSTLIRLPGYPIFLATCFVLFGMGKFGPVLWVQLGFSVADFCLIAALAARLMGRRSGLIALALGALCPFTANYCAIPLSETCVLFCVSLAFFSLERWIAGLRQGRPWNAWLAAIAFALSWGILLRPDQALVAVVVVPAMLWIGWRSGLGSAMKRSGPAVSVAVAIALPLLLWGVRNWRTLHVVQPLAPRFAKDPGEINAYGFQRWYRTWAIDFEATVNVYWNYDGDTVSLGDLPPRAFDNAAERAETARLYAEYNRTKRSTPAVDAGFMKLADERVAAHPLRFYLEIPALKVVNMWLRPRTEFMNLPLDWWRFRAHPRQSFLCLAYALLNAAYLALAALGLWRWRRQGWSGQRALAYAMVAFVLLRCALLWTIDNSEPRYTLECFPIVILLASFALPRKQDILSA